MLSWPLVRYVLLAAVRDRLILSAFALMLVIVALSQFVGGAAVVEKEVFVAVYAAGALRLLCAVAIILFTTFFVERSFERRDVEFFLSCPLSRTGYILSHVVALIVVAGVLTVLAGVALMAASSTVFNPNYLIWLASLFAELAMTGLVALFFAMVLPSAIASTLMVLAFYVLARMMGQLLGIVSAGVAFWGTQILDPVIRAIAVVVPRFDLMTQTSWLVYGPQGNEGFLMIAAQAGAFMLLVIVAALVDLTRRQF